MIQGCRGIARICDKSDTDPEIIKLKEGNQLKFQDGYFKVHCHSSRVKSGV